MDAVQATQFALGLLVWAVCVAVCFLKGKYGMALAGILVPFIGLVFAFVGAVRLAKPDSRWARQRYGEAKLRASLQRYPDRSPTPV